MRAEPVADPGTPDIRSPARYLWWLMAQHRASVLLGIGWGAVWMVAQALVPAVIGAAVDALGQRDTAGFGLDCGAVVLLGVLTAGTGVLRHRCVVSNFLDAAYRTIQLITGQAGRLGHTLARLLSTGEVVSVGTADVEAIGDAIEVTARASGAVAALGTVAVLILVRSVPLGLIVLIGGPVLTAVVALVLRPLHRRQQRYRDLQGQLAGRAADIVSGLRVLRGIGGEAAFSARFRQHSAQLRQQGVVVAGSESLLSGAEVLLPGLFVTVATWLAAHYALHGTITAGQLVSFYAYASFLSLPLATLTEAADHIVRGLVGAGRVVAILALEPDISDPALPRPEPPPGSALHDQVSGLTVAGGELLGVAAAAPDDGAALAERLGRYLTASGPAARLGAVPLNELPVDAARRRILVAANDAQLFAGPAAEQLSGPRAAPYGGGVPEAELQAALAAASAADVLDSIPGGLQGDLEARGRSLSGGQAQRLRLARALLADQEILVLVEPTSAVDAHTEAAIARRLGDARRGRTTVVVTTSPLVLAAMDRVAYLAGGVIAGHGSHRELLACSPGYAAAVARGAAE
jgi:ABC-type multidrug transport system fused ATPase/permease subunit